MAVNLSMLAGAGAQFFDNNGVILSGGLVYTYAAGTTTPQAAYTTSSGSTAHTNPIVLDSAGRVPSGGEIWLTDAVAYKFVLKTATATTTGTYDNITGNTSGIYAAFAASSGSSLIGFIQAGTGAVATTVQTKLRQTVSVKDFGAIGDGTTNDTAAFQAAINASKSIYIPSGTYLVTTIFIPYDRTITGAGRTATFITSATNQPIVNLGAPSSAKTQISNLTIQGSNNPAFTNQHGLSFPATASSGVYDCVFSNMEIRLCGGNGIDIKLQAGSSNGMYYCSFNDVKVESNLGYGANFQGGLFNTDIFINCVFNSNGLGGVYYHDMTSQTQEIKFISCFFESNGNGTSSAFGIWVDQLGSMLSVDNCFIEANGIGNAGYSSWGIRIKQPTYLSVTGSTLAAHAQHVYIDGMQNGVYVNIVGNLLTYNPSQVPSCLAAVYLDSCYSGLINYTGNADSAFPSNLQIVRNNYSSTPVIQNRTLQAINIINGQSKVLNGGFSSNTTNWNAANATLASVTGGQSGNCLQITVTSGSSQNASQTTNFVGGRLYCLSFAVKSGTSGNEAFVVYDSISNSFAVSGTSSASWVTYSTIFRSVSTVQNITLQKDTATSGTMLFDSVTITEIAQEADSDSAVVIGGNGGLVRSAIAPYSVLITASATVTIPVNIPVNCKIVGVQLQVVSALTAGDIWTAKFNNGSDVETITTTGAVAKNTQLSRVSSLATTATTNIVLTRSAGGSFTAAGEILAIVYIEQFAALTQIP